jgi:hypothetical protein
LEAILRLSRVAAFAIIWAGLFLAVILQSTAGAAFELGVGAVVAAALQLLWPLTAAIVLPGRFRTPRVRVILMVNLGAILLLSLVAPRLLPILQGTRSVGSSLGLIAWFYGILATLHLVACGARALVEHEEGGRVPLDRWIGTFLSFFFLPIGVLWIQPRLRSVGTGQ